MSKNKAEDLIKSAPVNKTILMLVIPALLGSIISQVNFILDSFFLSRVEYSNADVLIAAVAVAFPIGLFLFSIGSMFAIGGSIFGAKLMGEQKKEEARSAFMGTSFYIILVTVIFEIILFIFLIPILKSLGGDNQELLKNSYDYALILILGAPFANIAFVFTMFARAEGKSSLVLFALIFQTLLNIILNYLFIIPLQMGASGASLATAIAQISQAALISLAFIPKESNFHYKLNFKDKFKIKELKNVVFLGIPATLGILTITFASTVLQAFAAGYNDIELVGAIGILIKFMTMGIMIVQASATGIQPVFSYAYGAQDKIRFQTVVKQYYKFSTILSFAFGLFLIIDNSIFSRFLSLTGQSAYYVNFGTIGLGIMILVLNASFVMQVLFQSLDNPKTSMKIVIIRQLIIFLPIAFIFNNVFQEKGVLVSLQVGIGLGAIITFVLYYNKLKKLVQKSFK